jgi:hypothetical protein
VPILTTSSLTRLSWRTIWKLPYRFPGSLGLNDLNKTVSSLVVSVTLLACIIRWTPSRDSGDGRATGQPQGLAPEAYFSAPRKVSVSCLSRACRGQPVAGKPYPQGRQTITVDGARPPAGTETRPTSSPPRPVLAGHAGVASAATWNQAPQALKVAPLKRRLSHVNRGCAFS